MLSLINLLDFKIIKNEQSKQKVDGIKFIKCIPSNLIDKLDEVIDIICKKIINPKTKDSLIIKNTKKIKYPEFYKILITEPVAEKLNIKKDLPFVEILEIKKNKSFVAKKAKIFNEEKKISSKAPVTSVQISNISKNKNSNKNIDNEKIYILIASFYSEETAIFLKDRITKDIPSYDKKKLKINGKDVQKTF